MKSLILELPGFLDNSQFGGFPPSVDSLKLPLFQLLLSKSDILEISNFEGVEYSKLESSGKINPRHAAEYLQLPVEKYKYWFRADPVELQTDISTIHMKGNRHLSFSESQLINLQNKINQTLSHFDSSYFMISENEAYLGCNTASDVTFVSALKALGAHQLEVLPKGGDAAHWRQMITEIQMSLYGDTGPASLSKQKLAVNSVYFWGDVNAALPNHEISELVSDSNLILGLAVNSKLIKTKLSQTSAKQIIVNTENHQAVQVIVMELLWNRKQGILNRWQRTLEEIETHWLEEIISALKDKQLTELWILTGGSHCYRIKSCYFKRFWRNTKPLSHFLEASTH